MVRNQLEAGRSHPRAKTAAEVVLFMALLQACSAAPVTPRPTDNPTIVPAASPSASPTEMITASPWATESPFASPTPTIYITPSPTGTLKASFTPPPSEEASPTASPIEKSTPTATAAELKNANDLLNADHPDVDSQTLSGDIQKFFDNNPAIKSVYETKRGGNTPEKDLAPCLNNSSSPLDKAGACEFTVYGLLDTYKAIPTHDVNVFNLANETFNYFINQKSIPQAEKKRFKDDLIQYYS